MKDCLDEADVEENYADISADTGIQNLTDEIVFTEFASNVDRAIADGRTFGFLATHPGIKNQAQTRDSKGNERVRGMAALLVRVFTILGISIQARSLVILILPWGSAEATIKESELYSKIQRQISVHRFVDTNELQYAVLYSDDLRASAELHACIKSLIYSAVGIS